MEITKYKFRQSEEYSEEVNMTLTELQKDLSYINKNDVKSWVIENATIKSGKIKLFKRDANTKN